MGLWDNIKSIGETIGEEAWKIGQGVADMVGQAVSGGQQAIENAAQQQTQQAQQTQQTQQAQQITPQTGSASSQAIVGTPSPEPTPASTPTTYTDPNGQKLTGYLINGTTYTDPYGKNPVGVGSIVDAGGQQWIKTDNGSMLYTDYLKQQTQQPVTTPTQPVQQPAQQPVQQPAQPAATPTTYVDPNGQQQTGYLINGVTYVDAAGTTPVGVGSIVEAGGQQWIKTPGGSMLYTDYLKQQQQTKTPTPTTYTDPTGQVKTGYLINGVTYVDEAGTTPVGTGSIVDAGGQKWLKTENGSVPFTGTVTTYVDPDGVKRTGYLINDTTYTDPSGATRIPVGSVVDVNGQPWIRTENGSMLYSDYINGLMGGETSSPTTPAEEDALNQKLQELIAQWEEMSRDDGTIATQDMNAQLQELLAQWAELSAEVPEFSNTVSAEDIANIVAQMQAANDAQREALANSSTELPTSGTETVDNMKALLEEWKAAAEEQSNTQIDYATQQGIAELERALEDAQGQFKAQQDQIAADEAAAKDNAALYATMRGDRGGIGQAQYNAVGNTAAINRQTVASQQSKLATDTARQIADLRAQGEFEKADQLLSISQNYLSQLTSLEQWAAEYGLTEAQFKEAVRQWELDFANALNQQDIALGQWSLDFHNQLAQQDNTLKQWTAEYENMINQQNAAMQQWGLEMGNQLNQQDTALQQWQKEYQNALNQQLVSNQQWALEVENALKQQQIQNAFDQASLTGIYNGELTLAGKNQIADMAAALLEAGIPLSADQLKSLGMSQEQADAWQIMQQLSAASGGGGGTGSQTAQNIYEELWANGITTDEEIYAALDAAGLDADNYIDMVKSWQEGNLGTDAESLYNLIKSGKVSGKNIDALMDNWYRAGRISESEYKYLLNKALQGE